MAYLLGTNNIKLAMMLLLGLLFSSNVWAQGEPEYSVPTEASTQAQQVQAPENSTVDSGTLLDTKLELYKYIDQYADRQMGVINWIFGILGTLSLAVLATIGYFAKRYIDNIGKTVEQTTTIFLDEHFKSTGSAKAQFEEMAAALKRHADNYEVIKESLVGLTKLEKLAEDTQDASFAYRRCTNLVRQYRHLTDDEQGSEIGKAIRLEVSTLLDIVESEALKGSVTANTVFNAAANAGRIKDSLRSLRLMTLSVDLEPSYAHQMAKLDDEYKMGISYEVSDGGISRIAGDADTIRKDVFARAMKIVGKNKRQQSEIIVSRAWNMADRGRENGALDALIDVLVGLVGKEVKDDPNTTVTSYVYVILAQLYGRQAKPGWAAKAKEHFRSAIDLLAEESPMATWYDSSKKELGTISKRLGMYEDIKEYADGKNVELKASEGGDDEGQLAELMALMAAHQRQEPDRDDTDND